MKKIGNVLFLYFFVFVMCMGASFAWYVWQGANVDVNVVFSSVDKYINYETSVDLNGNDNGITASEDHTSGVIENIDFTKKDIAKNLDLYGSMYLKINECDTSTSNNCDNYNNLFKSSSLKWTLVSVNSSNVETEISTGNFVGEAVGNEIPMYVNFELDESITYKVYIWIDQASNHNLDISGLSLNTSIVSESKPNDTTTASMNDDLYVTRVEYGGGYVTDITLYSSMYPITGYMFTTGSVPSADDTGWTTVDTGTSIEEHILDVEVNQEMSETTSVCVKNSNSKVYCKSVGEYDDTVDVTYNSNNLLYNLVDVSNVTATNMVYSVSNGVVTVTGKAADGYGYTNGRVYLEAGREYIFSCDTTGTWGTGTSTVEAFLMLDGSTSTAYYRMGSNTGYAFTPSTTGVYWLRLDVNAVDVTHTFSNINISYNADVKSTMYGHPYGTLPTITRVGYTHNGWYNAASGGTQITSTTTMSSSSDHTIYSQWTANTYTVAYNNTCSLTKGGSTANSTHTYEVYKNLTANGYTCSSVVTYDYQGATGGNTNASATATSTFNGWATTSGGSVVYSNSESVANLATSGTVTLYTNWTNKSVSCPTPTKTGYTFAGWYDASTGGNKVCDAGGTYTPDAGTKTIYARWTANTYTVTLDNQSATTAGTTVVYYQYGTTKTVNGVTCYYYTDSALTTCLSGGYTIVKPAKTGWTFNGYFTSTGGSGTQYVNSSGEFINDVYLTTGNKTLYAYWIDDIAPSVPTYVANYDDGSGTYTSGTWATKQVNTTLTSTDSGTGVAYFQYQKNGGSWTTLNLSEGGGLSVSGTTGTGTEAWSVTDGRNDTIYFRACDAGEDGTAQNDDDNCSGSSAVYNIKYDNAAPSVGTTTPSTDYDIRNYVSFTGTDNASGIVGYNINTSSTTAPTTWIPVVSAVETTTETKYAYDAAWARVFYHNTHWGTVLYSDATEAKSSSTTDKYSVLGNMANYKNSSGVYEMLLEYPGVSGYNRWKQTDNPAAVTVANGTGSETAAGYTAVNVSWTGNYWGGLTLSTSSSTFINGSVGHSNWFYAIGSYTAWSGGIPGPSNTSISHVNLWNRIDDKTTTASKSLTRKIGDISANGTYYIWVKDAVGKTASKSASISKVDTTAPSTATISDLSGTSVTLSYADNVGVTKYYFGTSNPSTTNVTWTSITSTTSGSVSKTVSSSGDYYLGVQDAAGNIKVSSKTLNTSYTVTYNANGGSVSPTSASVTNGSFVTLPTPTYTGYTFNGWYTAASGGTKVGAAGASYTPTASITLYAQWSNAIYSITLNNQSATTAGTTKVYYQYNTTKVVDGVTCYYYTDSALTTCISDGYNITKPTKTGHTFKGYFTSTGGSGTQYVNAYGTFINNVYKTTGDKTLYAKWSENVYQIYNSSGTSTGYANSLANAISAVGAGGTIKALKANSSGAVTISKNMTLNTNSYAITMSGVITNSATLTLTGSGSITNTTTNAIENTGTLTLNGPNITTTGTLTTVLVYAGTVTVSSGTIKGDHYAVRARSMTGNVTLNVTGGTLTTATTNASNMHTAALSVGSSDSYKATVTISGGTFNSKGYSFQNSDADSTVTITKGTFRTDAFDSSNCQTTIASIGTLNLGTSSSTANSSNVTVINSCGAYPVYGASGTFNYNTGYLYSTVSTKSYDGFTTKNIRTGYKASTVSDSTYGYKTYLVVDSFANYITNLYNSGTATSVTTKGGEAITQVTAQSLSKDSNGNIRYYGASPNNYVTFNGETAGWRIIGVFDGKIKLLKVGSVADRQWDDDTNDWVTSTMKTYLTDTYLPSMTSTAQGMLATVTYYLGGFGSYSSYYADDFYARERSTTIGDKATATTWSGKIGLMYPSDYTYATDLSVCNYGGYYYGYNSTYATNCSKKDWINMSNGNAEWLISHLSGYYDYSMVVDAEGSYGSIDGDKVTQSYYTRPVVYLNASVYRSGGSGTSSSPYILAKG